MFFLQPIVDAILKANESSSRATLVVAGCCAEPVGRNCVWRISTDSKGQDVFFAKVWRDPATFRREIIGLELSRRIALLSTCFMSPQVEFFDAADRIHITRAINGKTFAELLKSAFRVDKNPFARRTPISDAETCLRQVLRWLDCLNQQTAPETDALLDHSIPGVVARIQGKLDRLMQFRVRGLTVCIGRAREVISAAASAFPSHQELRPVPVFGDVSPGNFIFDGKRIGSIDFEDVGLGDPSRDRFVLGYHLDALRSHVYYRSARQCRAIVGAEGCPPWKAAVFRLEFAVDALTNSILTDARPAGTPSSRRAVRDLGRTVLGLEKFLVNSGN